MLTKLNGYANLSILKSAMIMQKVETSM